ncbi:MAG: pitrilysin family protein [Pseudomonadota bacterium]
MKIAQFPRSMLVFLCLSIASQASAFPDGVTQGASVEGITEYQLDNGLRVVLFPEPGAEQITVNITYFVGSRHEGYGETGMAHLLEHLVFKGSTNHPDISKELTDRGARPNGTTWTDRTNYFETLKATDDNLAWAIGLEADRMVNSFISADDLESEMTVVRNEWESGENQPFSVLLKRVTGTAFHWHNYGKSTIGARADVENVPIERLQAFYRKYYQPDNAMLVVAGRFEEERALELIAQKFGAIPRPDRTGANQIFPTYTREPTQDGLREVTLRRTGDTQILMGLWHVPPGPHEDFPAIEVLTRVLTREPAGRLYKALVETGKAASVSAFSFRFREPGMLLINAMARQDVDLAETRAAMLASLEDLRSNPVTDEEVERAKREISKFLEQQFLDTESFARGLSEWAANGDWRLYFVHRDRIGEVTAADVARAVDRYLMESNLTIGQFIPTEETPRRAEIPDVPDVAALVADYKGREAVQQAEVFDPDPANVDARTERTDLNTGFRVALLPKQTRGGSVHVDFSMRFGSEEALTGRAADGALVADMLLRGTTERDRQAIQDELDRLGATMSLSGEAALLAGSIETKKEHLADTLRLLGEILKKPAFDDKEWNLLKEERLMRWESVQKEPIFRAGMAMSRHLNPWPENHPDYVPTIAESIARLDSAELERAQAFYREFVGASSGGHMVIVGDFDSDEILPLVADIFDDWQPSEPYVRFARPFRDVGALNQVIETPDKANAFLTAGMNLKIRDDDPDYPAMVLANFMLGGGFISSRLANRIREEEGLSYGVGSSFSAHGIDERGSFGGYAIFSPENGEKVRIAFLEELELALEEGFSADEVEAAKRGYLDGQRINRTRDDWLASTIERNLFYNRTMTRATEVENAIARLTPEQILAAMRRHIDIEKLSIVMAGDFGDED